MTIKEKIANAESTDWVREGMTDEEVSQIVTEAKKDARERLSLEETIKHYEEVAEELEEEAIKGCCDDTEIINKCYECADEHRQLADWLRELKYYKDRQNLINKSWQELINYKERIEKIKIRSQAYRECGETVLASGMEQALNILQEVNADEKTNS